MKKNRTMRAAVLMLALTLITSCFVGSTFAKYTTGISGSDTARVAKFGVGLAYNASNIPAEAFDNAYDGSVYHASQALVAPGVTSQTAFVLVLSGAPEVDVQVSFTLNADGADAGTEGDLSMVKLKNIDGGYKDYTDVTTDKKFNLTNDYYPVVWTLSFDASGTGSDYVKTGTLQYIEDYIKDNLPGTYHVNPQDAEKDFNDIIGTYTLTWSWAFNAGMDAADTFLGNLMAGTASTEPENYCLTEAFNLKVTVEQVD